jgi:putative tricarboxylic transport membrane protein
MNLRRDHVAGGGFVLAGATVLAVSSDLPFGTLASPGAGMLPTLIVGFLMAFGAVLFARAGESPPLGTIVWTDLPHAVRVVAVAALAIALYTTLGFVITVGALLFVLTFVVERRPFPVAAVFSIGVTALAYAVFGLLLKTPLPRGFMGF